MAIQSIDVSNILVFQRQWRKNTGEMKSSPLNPEEEISDGFHMDFGDGINVIIGENGVGKTSLLKMIYAATQWSIRQTEPGKTGNFLHFFSDHLKNDDALKNTDHQKEYCAFTVTAEDRKFEYSFSHNGMFNFGDWLDLNISSVFIPTTEMLSHAKGFLAMNQKYNMPFDGTQVDIIVNASLPETKEVTGTMSKPLHILSRVIQGTVVQEDNIFYVLKENGRKIDFSLEAEGFRKFGLLWKLIRNGLLEPGTVLLWDEPEANLNPELYPILAEVLLLLQENGVQIFLATHSYNFAKYLEIRRKEPQSVIFHNLYWGPSELPEPLNDIFHDRNQGAAIYSSSASKMENLPHNHIMMADEKLLDEVYDLRGE